MKSGLFQAQMRAVMSLTPIIVIFNIMLASMVVWLYVGNGSALVAGLWITGLTVVLGCYGLLCVRQYKDDTRTRYTSWVLSEFGEHRSRNGLHLLALVHGALWGVAAVYLSSVGHPDLKLVFSTCLVTILLVGGIALAAVPSLVLLYVLPIAAGGGIALWMQPSSWIVTMLSVLLFWVAIAAPFAARFFATLLKSHVSNMGKVREQSVMVTMLLEELQQGSENWIWETNAKGQLIRFPENLFEGCNLDRSMRLDELLSEVVTIKGTQLEELRRAIRFNLQFNDIILCVKLPSGEAWIRMSGRPVEDVHGNINGFVGTGSDITNEKLAQDRIEKLSKNDSLTGLMNRAVFSDRLGGCVENLERYGRPFTILFLDLDGFKLINDMRGHLAGDRLLAQVSSRIEKIVGDQGNIARLGGDEFAILLENQGDAGVSARLAGDLITDVSEAYLIDGDELRVGLSIGIAQAPLNGTRPDQLLRNADLALYRAKAEGRGVFRFFENNMDSELRERRVLEVELRDAVDNDELILHFQPLVEAKTFKTKGMESLIRWQHPIRGLLSPIEFVVLAEQSNLISEIGGWTLKKACESAILWPDDTFVAVNLSANHFMQSDIVEVVASVLRETGLEASRLELEITESLLINDPKGVIVKLEGLKELGVSVAMDDFGTGYSSLSYLMSVPFDKLKIDKSFVDEVTANAAGRKIVHMITSLAGELNLDVTAEGVETMDQAKFLAGIGCDILQGYLFAKPMPEEELPAYFLKAKTLTLESEDETKWSSDELNDPSDKSSVA